MKKKGPSVILYSHTQRKSDNLDNYNEESKQRLTATDDAPGGDDAGEGSSNHSKDYIQEKLNASGDHESGEARTFTRQETIWKKTYLATRIVLGSLNLCSLCLKIPILILIVRVLVELIQAKKQAETVTTIEPPYDDEPVPVPTGGDEGKRGMIIESLLLVVLYVSMLLVHTLCVFSFCANKGLYHLILYLPVILFWLFVYCVSYFVASWDGFLRVVIMIFRLVIHGIESASPDKYELKFLRISVWFDFVAFFLSIGYIIMYLTLKKDLRNDKISCRPHYNLLKLL